MGSVTWSIAILGYAVASIPNLVERSFGSGMHVDTILVQIASDPHNTTMRKQLEATILTSRLVYTNLCFLIEQS